MIACVSRRSKSDVERRRGDEDDEEGITSESEGMGSRLSALRQLLPMSSRGGWLRGKTVRKGGVASHTRSSTPQLAQTTSTTLFGGGVKDASGRTSEFFVSSHALLSFYLLISIMQSMDDQCPVCKSDRYLNPKLRLLVSSCYHKMYVQTLQEVSRSIITYPIGASHA